MSAITQEQASVEHTAYMARADELTRNEAARLLTIPPEQRDVFERLHHARVVARYLHGVTCVAIPGTDGDVHFTYGAHDRHDVERRLEQYGVNITSIQERQWPLYVLKFVT